MWFPDRFDTNRCTSTEERLEILDLQRGIVILCVAKTKALIGFAIAKLICALIFSYAKMLAFSYQINSYNSTFSV